MKFTFNWFGYAYQEGLRVILQSYLSASEAVTLDVERAKDEAFAYQEGVAQGGEWIGERDGEGVVIWDHQDILDMRVQSAEAAAMALRKAFALAFYHHWERSARGWTGSMHAKHEKLIAETQAKGYPVHNRLAAIRALANTLKHDNAVWGQRLTVLWPEVLTAAPISTGKTDWYELVHLTNAHLLEIQAALEASGPTALGH
ncbi:MAG: hypothetical protein ACM3YN_07025 [Parcubacteria group bacterium]